MSIGRLQQRDYRSAVLLQCGRVDRDHSFLDNMSRLNSVEPTPAPGSLKCFGERNEAAGVLMAVRFLIPRSLGGRLKLNVDFLKRLLGRSDPLGPFSLPCG